MVSRSLLAGLALLAAGASAAQADEIWAGERAYTVWSTPAPQIAVQLASSPFDEPYPAVLAPPHAYFPIVYNHPPEFVIYSITPPRRAVAWRVRHRRVRSYACGCGSRSSRY